MHARCRAYGIDLVSTGGTRKALADAGLEVLDVSDLTGFPEMMDGRVKTLHPAVHGGLLAVRNNPLHAEAMRAHSHPADRYPGGQSLSVRGDGRAQGAISPTCIENIDIGGPAMIRAAAKNHDDVAVVVDVNDYATLLDEFDRAYRHDDARAAAETCRQGLCTHGRLRCGDLELVRQ